MLTPEEQREIEHELSLVPRKSAACIEALKVVQRRRGYVSDEAIGDLAGILDMSPAELDAVATFYNLVFRRPVGRHVIFLCESVSCWILGCDALRRALETSLGIGVGETTLDKRFTLLPIQCLGRCDHAPALMIDEDTHADLKPDEIAEILEKYP
jgi:NADH-quinone oxidoreductase subunit E